MAPLKTIRNNLRFDYDQHAWAILVGFQMGRLELIFNNQSFDPEMNRVLAQTQAEIIEGIKPVLQAKGIRLHDEFDDYHRMNNALMRDLELVSARVHSFYMIGVACIRISMANDTATGDHGIIPLARSCIESIPSQYLQDKEALFEELLHRNLDKLIYITDYLTELNQQSILRDQQVQERAVTSTRKDQIRRLIAQHEANMYELELQKAKHGPTPPLYLINALKDVKTEIENLERELYALE
jgi:hypothetical protein